MHDVFPGANEPITCCTPPRGLAGKFKGFKPVFFLHSFGSFGKALAPFCKVVANLVCVKPNLDSASKDTCSFAVYGKIKEASP